MAAPIFQAIGRGYAARSILGAISRRAPQYANSINSLYYTGYTASSILSRIASKADGKNYDPDLFLTEHEQVQKRDQSQKRKAAMQLVAAAGTAGAVVAGAYALMRRNRAIQPDEILPAPHQRKQIGGKQQLALPHNPQQAQQTQQPPPSQPIQPITMPSQQQPEQQVPQAQPSPAPPDLMKTVDLLKNLREDQRFRNIIEGGYDLPTTTSILRAAMPKQVAQILEKSEGGLERVVNDYTQYLKQANEQQKEMIEQNKPENFAEMTKSTIAQAPQEQTTVMQEFQKAKQQQLAPSQAQQMPQQPIAEVAQQMIPPAPSNPLVSLKNGQIGEIKSEKGPVAEVNVNGKMHKEKISSLNREPPDVETAVREVINSIPENMKSTAVQSMVHIPGLNIMISQFYDGKWAYYLDMPEDIYQSVALGTYQPKGQAVTGIGEYKPGVADSRGAGFHQEIKINPKYSKENKGITWGYATNEYSLLHNIQGIIHKISKERYDEQGNLITPKTGTKRKAKGGD